MQWMQWTQDTADTADTADTLSAVNATGTPDHTKQMSLQMSSVGEWRICQTPPSQWLVE